MASIELAGIQKSFGAFTAVPDLDLKVLEGEFVAMVGPSGCGKSTLLRIIAGLEEATAGDVLLDGRVVNDLSPRERNVAMVFQSYALYPHMSVRENMSFNLKLAKMKRSEVERQVSEAARLLELLDLLGRRPSQLSGGQRQRVAMGRAIVRDPAIFLFDEPLSNLDAKLRVQMRGEIKALQDKMRTTSVYVTHDQIEAMTLADRIIVLNGGRVEQNGSPLELYRRPSNVFVAGFIGSPAMNFLPAEAEFSTAGPAARLADGTLLPIDPATRVQIGHKIVVGLRPEHLRIDAAEGLATQVRMVELTGAQSLVHIGLGGSDLVAVVDSDREFGRDMPVRVSIAPSQVHAFDADSGVRLN